MIPLRRIGKPEEVAALVQLPDVARCRLHHPPGDLGQRRHALTAPATAASSSPAPVPSARSGMIGRRCWPTCAASATPCSVFDDWGDIPRPEYPPRRAGAAVRAAATTTTARARAAMGRVALMATRATELALADAGLLGDPVLRTGACRHFLRVVGRHAGVDERLRAHGAGEKHRRRINATTYIKMMSHTAPVNIGVFFGITGRIITTSSACTSGSQGIGYAYEAIRAGHQDVMLAGGAEELDVTAAAVFDTLFATSTRNDTPELTPRPFDAKRDGLVIGEGACTLVLEELEHARARGATHPRRDRRLRHQQRRPARHAAQCRDHGDRDAPGAATTPAWRRRRSPTSTPTAPPPTTATSPRPRRRRPCSASAMPISSLKSYTGPHARRLRRARGLDHATR